MLAWAAAHCLQAAGQGMGLSEASQPCLGDLEAGPGLKRHLATLYRAEHRFTTQAQEDTAEHLKFSCAPCPLSQPRQLFPANALLMCWGLGGLMAKENAWNGSVRNGSRELMPM